MKSLLKPKWGWRSWPLLGQKARLRVRPSVLLIATLGFWLGACNHVKQDSDPTPAPLPKVLPGFNVNWQTGQSLGLSVDSLVPRPGEAYTFRFTQPVYGKLALTGGTLAYTPPAPAVVWLVDSAEYTICQDGSCGRGKFRIKNVSAPAGCIHLPVVTWLISALAQKSYGLPNGAKITAFSAENYTVDTSNGPTTLNYMASGNLLNFGYDVVQYSYSLSGQCYQGKILVDVGDSCAPGAKNGQFAAPAGSRFITETELKTLALGCRNQVANGVFSTLATGLGRVNTPYGTIKDSVVNGNAGLYYARKLAGAQPDTARYYFTSALDDRITRATLLITP